MIIGRGSQKGILGEEEIRDFSKTALSRAKLENKKVLIIIPDSTRTAPVGLFFRLFHELLSQKVKKLDYLIALGTHPVMDDESINKLLGISAEEKRTQFAKTEIFNHRWDRPDHLKEIGIIKEGEAEGLSGGLLKEEVRVGINKLIFDYDHLIILGPTFPHEVVGFSGGNKYFFPGIAGPEILHFFHWLGAIITNPEINGIKDTPVRRVINHAASFIKIPKLCFSLVVSREKVKGLFIASPEEAYSKAADLSSQVHIVYKEKSYQRILSIAPAMYDDLWTAGKCTYKLEPVCADGGEIIIYAPHVKEVSYTHGKIIDEIGYHVRDYFLKQMDKFKDIPRGIMAHSTHVRGVGTYENGAEKPRIKVTLATAIPQERCRRINLGYLDPKTIKISEWENREEEGILLVPKAGEMLFRLKKPA